MAKITKAELVDNIYKNSGYERQTVLSLVDSFMEELKTQMLSGNVVELRGFGTFEPKLRKGRSVAHNPKTGEKCSVPPHYVGSFRPGQELKKGLWELPVDKDAEK